MIELDKIRTEQRNERTADIDQKTVLEMLQIMNEEDKKVAFAVEKELPRIASASTLIYQQMKKGGRLIYIGCGTSGRLGVLDAAECPPTFGTTPDMVQAIMAGGSGAFLQAVEGAEDDMEAGAKDLEKIQFTQEDILVGLAASGRTPYVLGAMKYAHEKGAAVVAVTCCPNSMIDEMADIAIAPAVGAEVITGSTRLKSGTAQKMILNMISTTVMIQMGKVYGNLMVDVKATNAKLIQRTINIVKSCTGVTDEEARKVLEQCDFSAKIAIIMILLQISAQEAEKKIKLCDGKIYQVLQER